VRPRGRSSPPLLLRHLDLRAVPRPEGKEKKKSPLGKKKEGGKKKKGSAASAISTHYSFIKVRPLFVLGPRIGERKKGGKLWQGGRGGEGKGPAKERQVRCFNLISIFRVRAPKKGRKKKRKKALGKEGGEGRKRGGAGPPPAPISLSSILLRRLVRRA